MRLSGGGVTIHQMASRAAVKSFLSTVVALNVLGGGLAANRMGFF